MCYDDVAHLYEARGYHPLPIDPEDKFPVVLRPDGTYQKLSGWPTQKVPLKHQGRAGLGIRTGVDVGVVGIDVDTDDPDIQAALPAIVRDSLVKKRGQRGYTSFLYGPGTKSRKFLIDGKTVVEILGVGRQTVIPPSVHPVTQKPYEWVGDGFELLDVEPARDLAHVPADFETQIEDVLRRFGWEEEEELAKEQVIKGEDDGKSPHSQLNDYARANLQKWVPHLGLEKYRRKRGPHLSYEAVATWRPSTQGRELRDRNYNLSITAKSGIKDFGDGRSYTPLDLVMAARTLSLSDAFVWLDDKLGWSSGGPEIVIPREGGGESAGSEEPQAGEAPQDGQRRKPRPPAGTGEPWHFGSPAPALPPMLVPGLLPRKGYGYLGGQWGTLKTFITNDLAIAVATGGKFAGQQLTMRGVVIQIELEGSHSELRLQAAADAREIDRGELPIVHLRSAPHTIMNNGKTNPEWSKWSKDLVRYAKEVAEYYELPLALITLDPQNRLAGFKDEQSSSEGQIVSNALAALWEQADCLVLAVDHLGKDPGAGLRGTSAKETNPLFILSTGETKKDIHAQRELVVRKMRNGAAGLAVPFWAVPRDVTIKQEVVDADGVVSVLDLTETTLTIRWGDEMRPAEGKSEGQDDPVKGQQLSAMRVLSELINGKAGVIPPPECEIPSGLKAIKLDTWRLRLVDKTVIEGKNTAQLFSQLKTALLNKGEIDISAGFVWPKFD